MNSHHLALEILEYGENSVVYWSTAKSTEAIVFIHGFGGHATDTWDGFPELTGFPKEFLKKFDIYFYGYPSKNVPAEASSVQFDEFINYIYTNNSDLKNTQIDSFEFENAEYHKIYIVAHSLGAIIARKAMLNGITLGREWISRTELIFYAPAHMGANIIALVAESINTLFKIIPIAPIAKYVFPVLADLQKDSSCLKKLAEDTLSRVEDFPNLSARLIKIGNKDRIIEHTPFPTDPPPSYENGVNHTDICKPKLIGSKALFHKSGVIQ